MEVCWEREGAQEARREGNQGSGEEKAGERAWTHAWAEPFMHTCANVLSGIMFLVLTGDVSIALTRAWLLATNPIKRL